MMADKYKLLLVEDEKDTVEILTEALADHFEIAVAFDGEECLDKVRTFQPHIVLLDLNLPKVKGDKICDLLRSESQTRNIQIVVLSGNDDEETRLKLFANGADDFVGKPYRIGELTARLQSRARRITESGRKSGPDEMECGNLKIVREKMLAAIDNVSLILSVLEFDLLCYFVENREKVLSREMILKDVWGEANVSDRTVDTHIVSLRKRLKGFDHNITTIYGAGYVLKKA